MISSIYGHYLTWDALWTTDKTAVELNPATGCQLRIVLVLIFRIKEEKAQAQAQAQALIRDVSSLLNLLKGLVTRR